MSEERKLFVGGLSWETGEPDLAEYFGQFGEVESVNLKIDPNTGKSRCFAFIVYKSPEDLSKCFAQPEHAINSKKVDVKKARAKPGKIFVGGLKPEMTDDDVRAVFEQYGAVIEMEMPFDKVKNQRKGFGFITFEREETMKELIKLGKVQINGQDVDLRKATPKSDMFGYGGMRYGAYPMMDYYGGYGSYYGGYGGYGGSGGSGGYDYAGGGGGGAGGWGGESGYSAGGASSPAGGGKIKSIKKNNSAGGSASGGGANPY